MAWRKQFIDLDLRGVSEIVNPKADNRSIRFVKNLENLSAVEIGSFETRKKNDSRILFDTKKEGIKQVLNINISDLEERTGILTDKSMYINDLSSDKLPLLTSPVSIQNIDYDLSLLSEFPAGIVSCACSPILNILTHVLVLTYDKKLFHLQVKFETGKYDKFYNPRVIKSKYIANTFNHNPILYTGELFYFFNGSEFSYYDPDTETLKGLVTLNKNVKTFLFIDDSDDILKLNLKFDDDTQSLFTYNLKTGAFTLISINSDVIYPFERNDLNGYDQFFNYFNSDTIFSKISFVPGSGYFYHYKKLEEDEMVSTIEQENNCVQAKFLSDRALAKAPPVPPVCWPGLTGMDSVRGNLTGNGFFQVFPIILPSKLINSDGSIPQPNQLYFIKIYETENKIKSLRFGNQNLISGSLLRQFDKGRLVEFGFNALPELKEIERVSQTNNFQDTKENISAITEIDNQNAFQMRRIKTVINSNSNVDTNFDTLDKDLPNIYALPPLSLISNSAGINRVYKAVFSWTDSQGVTHRSEPSLTETYNGEIKTEQFIYLDQVFKVYFTKNENGVFVEDESKLRELVSQRWDFHHIEPEEKVDLVSKLNFTQKSNVNIELYSTDPSSGSSLNFFLIKTIDNDRLDTISFPAVNFSVACEDIVDNRELGTYNTDEFLPKNEVVFGRLYLDSDSSVQPDGCYNIEEHDNKLYLALPYELIISEKGSDSKDIPSLIFKNVRVPLSERSLGIFSQDNNLVIFSKQKVHIYNESFDSPRSLRSPDFNLQNNNRHFISMQEGIIFKDEFKGIFVFTRANEFQYIGSDIDKKKEIPVLDILQHPKKKEIIFLAKNQIMIYNWFFKIWTFSEDVDAVSIASTNNEIFMNEKLGNLIVESPDLYKREGTIESHFLSLTSEVRKKRFIGIRIAGDLEELTSIRWEYAFNGRDDFQAFETGKVGKGRVAGTMKGVQKPLVIQALDQPKRIDLYSPQQKCASMKFRIMFRSDDLKKIKIDKISLIVKVQTNLYNIADALRIG